MYGKIKKLHLSIQHMNQVLKDPIEYKEPTSNSGTFLLNRNIMENIYSSSSIIISSVLAKPLASSSSLYKNFSTTFAFVQVKGSILSFLHELNEREST